MAWVKIDDRLHRHKKIQYAGMAAADLFVAGLEYCNLHLTDGFIPANDVAALRTYVALRWWLPRWVVWLCRWLLGERLRDQVLRLTASVEGKRPLWQKTEREGVPGYLVNDFHQYQPKRETVLYDRRRAAEQRRKRRSVETATTRETPSDPLVIDTDSKTESEKTLRLAASPGTYVPGKEIPIVLLSEELAKGEVCDAHTRAPAREVKPPTPDPRYAFASRVSVPIKLHRDFLRRLGGDSTAADHRLQVWYRQVSDALPADVAIAENDFRFWEPRFTAWVQQSSGSLAIRPQTAGVLQRLVQRVRES